MNIFKSKNKQDIKDSLDKVFDNMDLQFESDINKNWRPNAIMISKYNDYYLLKHDKINNKLQIMEIQNDGWPIGVPMSVDLINDEYGEWYVYNSRAFCLKNAIYI